MTASQDDRGLKDQTILIKIGGSTLGAEDTSFADVAELQHAGARVVIVHGGGPETTSWMAKMGVRAEFVDGLRVTDEAGLGVATAVLAGLVNKRLVAQFAALGVRALGLSGVDGGMVRGRITKPELGFVAGTVDVDAGPLDALLVAGYVPVISPIGTAVDDAAQLLNINADTVAGAIAVAVGATHLVFLTDVDGILDAHGRLLKRIPLDTAEGLMTSGVVKGGMIPKLEACIQAGNAGISAHIVNGTKPQALVHCLDGTVPGTSVA
ncbi:MAG: acetylglutamate kinase [Chloroflexi bacterium]|nr:acetylglutamate kinase [Chloroflexota bacterium]MDA1174985.1 acetylglutamate kinase [Chloroflexota bacterium]